jgi:hypothetical protein
MRPLDFFIFFRAARSIATQGDSNFILPRTLNPQMQPAPQHVREASLDDLFRFTTRVSRAEMGCNNQVVLKSTSTLDEIIEMHVTILVNELTSVVVRRKGHFCN